MRSYAMPVESDKDKTIDRLKDELWMLRSQIINLPSYEMGQILRSFYACPSMDETYVWLDQVAAKIISYAVPLEPEPSIWGGRANCPLCGLGAGSPYQEGFALPEGLRRHLVGYGNTHKCLFTETAQILAREHWREQFAESEREKYERKRQDLARRRNEETLYQLNPFDDGQLLDEGMWSTAKPRTAEEMGWAESRLQSLALEKRVSGNLQSWIDEREYFVVYADMRQVGRIDFSVWKKPLPKRRPIRTHNYEICRFYLLDTWGKDLRSKYESRLPKL